MSIGKIEFDVLRDAHFKVTSRHPKPNQIGWK